MRACVCCLLRYHIGLTTVSESECKIIPKSQMGHQMHKNPFVYYNQKERAKLKK